MQITQNNTNCTANYIVISTIPILFFLFVALGYIGVVPMNISLHTLSILGFILFVFLLFISHNANYSICKMRSSYAKLRHEVQEKIDVTKLTLNNQSKSILDLDAF